MNYFRKIISKKKIHLLITIGLSLFVFSRVVIFSNNYGAIEHDSGHYYGIAHNLAKNGLYASFNNPNFENHTNIQRHQNIIRMNSIQNSEGHTLFSSAISVGAPVIFPIALVVKIFGANYSAFKFYPLMCFLILLFVLFYVVYYIGGIASMILLFAWLWIIPQQYIGMAYEALGEHIALMFLLLSFIVFHKSNKVINEKSQLIYYSLSGFLFAMSCLTKMIVYINISSFLLLFVWNFYKTRKFKLVLKRMIFFLMFFLAPIFLFELYRFVYIYKNYDFNTWLFNINAHIQLFQLAGGRPGAINFDFIISKLSIFKTIGIDSTFSIWILFASSFVYLIIKKKNDLLIWLILLSSLITSSWYLGFSSTGLTRHNYLGIFFIQIIICGCLGIILSDIYCKLSLIKATGLTIIFLSIISIFFSKSYLTFQYFLDESDVSRWHSYRYKTGVQGFPSIPIFSLKEQKEVLSFIKNNNLKNSNYFYIGVLQGANISGILGKVFYSVHRYLNEQFYNKINKMKNYVLFTEYSLTDHKVIDKYHLAIMINNLCKNILFQNGSFMICEIYDRPSLIKKLRRKNNPIFRLSFFVSYLSRQQYKEFANIGN